MNLYAIHVIVCKVLLYITIPSCDVAPTNISSVNFDILPPLSSIMNVSVPTLQHVPKGAVGEVLHKLSSKCISKSVSPEASHLLSPLQLGVKNKLLLVKKVIRFYDNKLLVI